MKDVMMESWMGDGWGMVGSVGGLMHDEVRDVDVFVRAVGKMSADGDGDLSVLELLLCNLERVCLAS